MDDGSASYKAWAVQRNKAAAFDILARTVGRSFNTEPSDVEHTLRLILSRLAPAPADSSADNNSSLALPGPVATAAAAAVRGHQQQETQQQHHHHGQHSQRGRRLIKTPPAQVFWTSRAPWRPYFAAALAPDITNGGAGALHSDDAMPAPRNVEVRNPLELPSQRALRDRRAVARLQPRKKMPPRPRWVPASFRLERGRARAWCTNPVLDDLESKDGLARRVVASGAAALAPATVLIPWDDVELPEEAMRLIASTAAATTGGEGRGGGGRGGSREGDGDEEEEETEDSVLVLKPAMGSGGRGIEFHDARDPDTPRRIMEAVRQNAAAALQEGPAFMKSVRQQNHGRVPGYVLQRHVRSAPARGGRKCHLRSYVVVDEAGRSWQYAPQVEVRVAPTPLANAGRAAFGCDRAAHITNGAGGDATERALLEEDCPELVAAGAAPAAVRSYLAELFGKLLPKPGSAPAGAAGAVGGPSGTAGDEVGGDGGGSDGGNGGGGGGPGVRQLAVVGADIMLDRAGRLLLLELNRNPAAPPPEVCTARFREHLVEFTKCLVSFALDGSHPAFVPIT